ncbi:MAG: hypothetical protein WA604_05005, partial [Candidatus Sulfotelmatobacter sp.]
MRALPSLLLFVLVNLWWSRVARAQVAAQTPAPATTSASAPSAASATQTPAQTSTAELNSRDEPTTFKVNVRLVLVR